MDVFSDHDFRSLSANDVPSFLSKYGANLKDVMRLLRAVPANFRKFFCGTA